MSNVKFNRTLDMIEEDTTKYAGMTRDELLPLIWEALDRVEKLLTAQSVRLGGPTFEEWMKQQEGNNDSHL